MARHTRVLRVARDARRPRQGEGPDRELQVRIDGAGTWHVDVDDGHVKVTEDDGERRRLHDHRLRGDLQEDRQRRAEPDRGLHVRQAEGQGRHGPGDEAPEALLGLLLELDQDRAAGDPVAFRDVHGADGRLVRRRRAASPSSSPRARAAAGAAARGRPRATSTLITVPGIGAVSALCSVRAVLDGGVRVGRRGRRRHGQVEPEAAAPRAVCQPERRRRERRMLGEERGRRLAGAQGRVRDEPAQERQVRRPRPRPRSRRARRRGGRARPRASSRARSASRSAGRTRCRSRRPPRRRRRRGSPAGGVAARAGRSAAGTSADPRRRAAPRPRGPDQARLGRERLALRDPDLLGDEVDAA